MELARTLFREMSLIPQNLLFLNSWLVIGRWYKLGWFLINHQLTI